MTGHGATAAGSGPGRLEGWLSFGLGAAVIRSLVIRIRATGAVPGDEFTLAGILYAALPAITLLAAGLLAAAIVILLRERRRDGDATMAYLQAATAAAAFFSPWGAVAALLVLWRRRALADRRALEALTGEKAAARDALADAFGAIAPLEFLRWWLGLTFLAALGAFLITLAESFVYTARFSPELFAPELLGAYRLRLLDLAVMFGMAFGVGTILPAIVFRLTMRRASAPRRIMNATRLVAGAATLYSLVAFGLVVGQEIVRTGVVVQAVALHLLAHHFWCRRMRRNIVLAGYGLFGGEAPEGRSAWLSLYQALFLVPIEYLPRALARGVVRSARTAQLVSAAVGFLWLVVFVLLSYPELEDFRIQFISIAVFTAVNVFLLACLSVLYSFAHFRRRRAGRVYNSAMAGVAIFGLVSTFRPLPNDVAVVVNEYSRFGFMLKMASLRELIRPKNRLGEEPSAGDFPYHGVGEERLDHAVPGCYGEERPPIVIVVWDAARPDYMGPYGRERGTTPNVDRLAAESVVFERAYSGSTATSCGIRHLMTGRYSTRFMLSRDHAPYFIHDLRPRGYRRFLVTGVGSDFNGVSFESFRRNAPAPETDGSIFVDVGTDHPDTQPGYVDEQKSGNVIREWRRIAAAEGPRALEGSFTYLHLTGTHFPWRGSPPLEDLGPRPEDRYDAEMKEIDRLTGRVFDCLRELELWERAIVVLVADHGTGLRDHGRYAGFYPYEEQIRVPLLVKAPGFAPRRVSEPVATIDLGPTLRNLFEPGVANPYHGVSLVGLMSGADEHLGRRAIAGLCAFEDEYFLLVDGRFKLHFHRQEDYGLLFDLAADPRERRNLFAVEVARRDELMALMSAFLRDGKRFGWGHPHHYWP